MIPKPDAASQMEQEEMVFVQDSEEGEAFPGSLSGEGVSLWGCGARGGGQPAPETTLSLWRDHSAHLLLGSQVLFLSQWWHSQCVFVCVNWKINN